MGKKSIKASKRTGKLRPIHKVINSPNVPLPQVWEQFMALDENKADLAEFLSHEMMLRTKSLPDNCHLVVGGGFPDPDNAQANKFDAVDLCVDHEEADTRIVIHAKHAINLQFGRVAVKCRDTDVLLLLIYHRLSPSPFVFCEIYEYCMTFEETVSPDKRTFLTHFRK